MVVNDQALKQRLKGGVGVAYLPPGTYRVKVVRTGFRDSAEQQLTIGAGDSPPPLKFLLAEAVPEVRLIVDSAPAGAEVILDGKHAGVIDSAGRYQSNVATGKHTLTLRKPNFEEFTTSRDFELGNDMKISTEGMKAFGRLTFHVSPATAHILCVPDKEGEPRDCSNNEGCYLRAGMYEITVSAANFKTEIYRVRIEPGDSKSFEWELAATSLAKPASSGPESLFENGKDWTINELGWWSHTQSGYSFMRVNRGTFVFDILKRHGALSHPKISFVADFRGDTNRVLYTIDEHTLRRNVRNPGVGLEDFVVAHGMPPDSNYRLKVEILPDHVVIHSGDGKILDDFPLVKPVTGKFGFVGKVTLMVVEQQSDLEK
jgi:hypothetical protein